MTGVCCDRPARRCDALVHSDQVATAAGKAEYLMRWGGECSARCTPHATETPSQFRPRARRKAIGKRLAFLTVNPPSVDAAGKLSFVPFWGQGLVKNNVVSLCDLYCRRSQRRASRVDAATWRLTMLREFICGEFESSCRSHGSPLKNGFGAAVRASCEAYVMLHAS